MFSAQMVESGYSSEQQCYHQLVQCLIFAPDERQGIEFPHSVVMPLHVEQAAGDRQCYHPSDSEFHSNLAEWLNSSDALYLLKLLDRDIR